MTTKIVKVDPNSLKFAHETNLSRYETPEQRAEEIKTRAIELFNVGQKQPIRVQGTEDKPGKVYIGHTRALAGQLIRKGFSYVPDENDLDGENKPKVVPIQDEKWTVDVVYDDISDEEAAVAGVVDNFQSDRPNDLDVANAARALKNQYGYTDTKITQLLHISDPNKVREVSKLLTLPKSIQEAVRTERIATDTALAVLDFDGETRDGVKKLLLDSLSSNGKTPTAGKLRSLGRQAEESGKSVAEILAQDAPNPTPSATAVLKLFDGLAVDLNGVNDPPESYVNFVGAMRRYLKGGKVETFQSKMDEAFGFDWPKAVATTKKGGRKKKDATTEEVAQVVEGTTENPVGTP